MPTDLLERKRIRIPVITNGYDKRYFPRWEVNKRVEYIEEGRAAFQSYTKDLTLGGISVIVFGKIPAVNRVQLRIHLAEKENFEASGRIVWSKLEPADQLLGIVFENISRKAQKLIMRHAFVINNEVNKEIRAKRPAEEEVKMTEEAKRKVQEAQDICDGQIKLRF